MTLALRACDSLRLTFRSCGLCRACSGDAPEDRPVGEAGSARVVEIEDSTHKLSRSIEARDRLAIGRDDLGVGVDAQAAEGEGDAAGHRVGCARRGIEVVGPVRLV